MKTSKFDLLCCLARGSCSLGLRGVFEEYFKDFRVLILIFGEIDGKILQQIHIKLLNAHLSTIVLRCEPFCRLKQQFLGGVLHLNVTLGDCVSCEEDICKEQRILLYWYCSNPYIIYHLPEMSYFSISPIKNSEMFYTSESASSSTLVTPAISSTATSNTFRFINYYKLQSIPS